MGRWSWKWRRRKSQLLPHHRRHHKRPGCTRGQLQMAKSASIRGYVHDELGSRTIKLVPTGQSRAASAAEDALSVAQLSDVRTTCFAQAIHLREHHDAAPIARPDAGDTLRKIALEAVRARGTATVERQGDRRSLSL